MSTTINNNDSKLNVLHISMIDYGGAGLAVLRIHKALVRFGVNSNVLVLEKTSDTAHVYSYQTHFHSHLLQFIINQYRRGIKAFWNRSNRYILKVRMSGIRNHCFYSSPVSLYRVENHPLIKNADIIHLHWIQNFINYPTFFKKVDKPIIWTLHDENILYGGFHYSIDSKKLGNQYKDIEDNTIGIKRNSFLSKQNMILIPISNMLKRCVDNVDYCNHLKKKVIHIPVDLESFTIHNKKSIRQQLGLPLNKKIILFVSCYIFDENKGLTRVIDALKLLHQNDLLLCCVGGGNDSHNIDIPNVCMGYIEDETTMSMIYSAADLFVLASMQESFAQTPLESIASGTPVVATPCGVTEELINEHNGVRCNDFSVEELARCIEIALIKDYDPQIMRQDVIMKFSPDYIAQQYYEIYHQFVVSR